MARPNLGRDSLDWLSLSSHGRIPKEDAARQKRTARALLERLYGRNSVPGVILADEVGMGKTYVVFAVMAALFKSKPTARVLILAHSRQMARTWMERWERFCQENIRRERSTMPDGELLPHATDIAIDGLAFGSYDTIKHVSRAALEWALERILKGKHASTRRALRKSLLGSRRMPSGAETLVSSGISAGDTRQFWRDYYDSDTGDWMNKWSAKQELHRLIYKSYRTKRKIDLLIVDEAHKASSDGRSHFFEAVMSKRTKRVLYVTATPFALRLSELHEHLKDLHDATGEAYDRLEAVWDRVREFADVVDQRGEAERALKTDVQERLGRYLVRSLWPDSLKTGTPTRTVVSLEASLGEDSDDTERRATALLALETGLVDVFRHGGRTHAAAHRETLNSSYAAIRHASKGKSGGVTPPAFLKRLATEILPARAESPKFQRVYEYLVSCALDRQKVVVFCRRQATIQEFRTRLVREPRLREMLDADRALWKKLNAQTKGAGLLAEDRRLLRLAAHHEPDRVLQGAAKSGIKRMNRLVRGAGVAAESTPSEESLWAATWGAGRRVEWVGVISGASDKTEDSRVLGGLRLTRSEIEQFAFNLPGPPYILLCSKKAREGIDLHRWCRRVVQYDLEWNPAMLEQQVGRIDRLGSLSRREGKPVDVVYAWVPGTYEEYMASSVQERQQMMRVLLGAGDRLADTLEEQERVELLDRYRLDFAP